VKIIASKLKVDLEIVNLMFVDPCIIVQFIRKSNKMQQCINIYYSYIY